MPLTVLKLSSTAKTIKKLLFKKAGWISFFVVAIFVILGLSFFYFGAWSPANSVPPVSEIKLPLDQALWRTILSDAKRRRGAEAEIQGVKNIFR